MKLLFATTNQAKINKYKEKLAKEGIKLISLKDLDFKLDIEENGKNAIENAYIKAKAYYDATQIATIGMDNNLFIEGLPEEKQPGTHVRRVGGKELSDDEMITYYTDLVKQYGGKMIAKWVYGMVFYDGKEEAEYTWSKDHFYLVDTPSEKRNPGYPLDSMTIIPEYNEYLVERSKEKKKIEGKNSTDDGVINFIVNHIKE